jgi:hypothetical protein
MDKSFMIRKIIIDAMEKGYREYAERTGQDAEQLIADNHKGLLGFADDVTTKIMLVINN